MKCTSCPSGQTLDAVSKVCVPLVANATNPNSLNLTTGTKPSTSTTDVPCPS